MSSSILGIESKLDKEITSFFKSLGEGLFLKDKKKSITYRQLMENKLLMIEVIRMGIPFKVYDLIKSLSPFEEADWASFLDVSTKTLQRYKTESNHRFKSSHSEKIMEMAEVTQIGLDVFGSIEKLRSWLHTPSFALGNVKPVELLKDSYGKELVLTELVRINHGILV